MLLSALLLAVAGLQGEPMQAPGLHFILERQTSPQLELLVRIS